MAPPHMGALQCRAGSHAWIVMMKGGALITNTPLQCPPKGELHFGTNTKLMKMSLENLSLCENVCCIFWSWTILHLNYLPDDQFSHKVVLDFDVLCASMENWILGYCNAALVITLELCWMLLRHSHKIWNLTKPYDLTRCKTCWFVFSFCWWKSHILLFLTYPRDGSWAK